MSLPMPKPRTVTLVAATATLTGMLTSTILLNQMWENSRALSPTALAAPADQPEAPQVLLWPVSGPTAETAAHPKPAKRSASDRLERERASRSQRTKIAPTATTRKSREPTQRAHAPVKRTVKRAKGAKATGVNAPVVQKRTVVRKRTVLQKRTVVRQRTAVRPASRSRRGIPAQVASLNWAALAHCESTGNPKAVNPSGRYLGLYQFDRSTWASVGGSGLPTSASAAEQTYRAQLLYVQRGGSSPWPVCGRRLHR